MAIRVESTGMGGDRSLIDRFTCMLKVLQCFKDSKEKKIKSENKEEEIIEEWL